MQISISKDLKEELGKIKKKDKNLTKRIEKQLLLFSENPKHLSLRIHKLSGKLKNTWSLSITKSIRMVYFLQGDNAYFFDIGTHDEIYGKKN